MCLVDSTYSCKFVNSSFVYLNILTIIFLYFLYMNHIWYCYIYVWFCSPLFSQLLFVASISFDVVWTFFCYKILFVELYRIPLRLVLKVHYFKKFLDLHMSVKASDFTVRINWCHKFVWTFAFVCKFSGKLIFYLFRVPVLTQTHSLSFFF